MSCFCAVFRARDFLVGSTPVACSAQLLPPSATATASDAAGILVWFSELSWLDQSVAGYYAALVVLLQAWQASHHDGYVVWVGCGSFLSQIPWIVHAVQVTVLRRGPHLVVM
jgi:apolipoprotein N-acyltransferase